MIDATGSTNWNRNKELKKLRTKILNSCNAPTRNVRNIATISKYAEALGISKVDAEARVLSQHSVDMTMLVGRRFTDATGPTKWEGDGLKVRRKTLNAIHRRMYGGGRVSDIPVHDLP